MSEVMDLEGPIARVVMDAGYEMHGVDLRAGGGKIIYRVYVERLAGFGITMDEVVKLTHLINKIVDELDPFDDPWTLEVSSPGAFRRINTDKDWERAAGKRIRVWTPESTRYDGTLQSSPPGVVVIKDDRGMMHNFSRADVRVNLQPLLDFGDHT